jgi:hypothetical protein
MATRKNALREYLEYPDCIHQNIRFIIKIEEKGTLPFLGVLVTRRLNGTLRHTVYRKPTHTDLYFNARSEHHPEQ